MKRYFFYTSFLIGLFTVNSQCLSKLDSGFQYSYGLKSNGTLWDWGSGVWGQLGDGTELYPFNSSSNGD